MKKTKPESEYIFLKFHRLSDRVVNKKELKSWKRFVSADKKLNNFSTYFFNSSVSSCASENVHFMVEISTGIILFK